MSIALASDVLPPTGVAPTIVSEICAPALLLGVQLRSAHEFGELATLRQRMHVLVDHIEEQLREARLSSSDVANIAFALVAFLDESISQSGWSRKAEWIAKPMHFERFSRYDAGEEFFTRLATLQAVRPLPTDILQIYFLCLTLGFRGKYLLLPDEECRELVAGVGTLFRKAGDQPRALLGPNGLPGEDIAEVVKEIPVWVFAVAAASIAFLVYVVLRVMISWRATTIEGLIR